MTLADTNAERYELIDRIAIGGMAEVYRAKAFGAHGFEKTLAIKRILPELAAQPEFEDRFIAEAKLAVALSHANIVQVLDFGRFAGSLFIAMEYVDGLDMAGLLKALRDREQLIPLPAAFQIAIEICRGLDFAHKHKVIHRDVSPSNILLSRAGEVKVADFGIAEAVTKGSSSDGWKKIMGKWRYMSPEQTRGLVLTTQSDVFSLASVLFEMFTGQKLFPGEESEDIVRNIDSMRIPPAVRLREGVPPRLDEILRAALVRDPMERTTSAMIMQRQLTELCYESSILATPLDVSELVTEIVETTRPAAASAQAGGQAGIDALIREQLLGGLAVVSEGTRRTAVEDEEPELDRETAVTASSAILSKRTGSDGITVWELDHQTIAAGPRAIRKTGSLPAVEEGATIEPAGTDEGDGRRGMWLGLAALVLGGLGFVGFLLFGGAEARSEVDAAAVVGGPADASVVIPSRATLRVDSVPAGAQVSVNGRAQPGLTPTSVAVEPGKDNRIRVELAGHEPWEEASVIVPEGETLLVRPQLVRLVAALEIDSRPEGAEVVLNGVSKGVTPLVLSELEPARGVPLTLKKEGFKPVTLRVDLVHGKKTRIERSLVSTTVYGTIDLQVDDGWAEVYFQGRRIGRAPVQGLKLPVGKHSLRLVNPPTRKETTLQVEVSADQVNYYRTRL